MTALTSPEFQSPLETARHVFAWRIAARDLGLIIEHQPDVILMPVRLAGLSVVAAHPKTQSRRQCERRTVKRAARALAVFSQRTDRWRRSTVCKVAFLRSPRTWRFLIGRQRHVKPFLVVAAGKRGSDLFR